MCANTLSQLFLRDQSKRELMLMISRKRNDAEDSLKVADASALFLREDIHGQKLDPLLTRWDSGTAQ